MIVSHEHKFIFLKTKKTAGTSIELALSALCESGWEPRCRGLSPSCWANVGQTACGEGDLIFTTADWLGKAADYGLPSVAPAADLAANSEYLARARLDLRSRSHRHNRN
jgi:hypothetical protein